MGPLSLTFTIGAVIGMILFVPIMIYLANILKLVEKLDRRSDNNGPIPAPGSQR